MQPAGLSPPPLPEYACEQHAPDLSTNAKVDGRVKFQL